MRSRVVSGLLAATSVAILGLAFTWCGSSEAGLAPPRPFARLRLPTTAADATPAAVGVDECREPGAGVVFGVAAEREAPMREDPWSPAAASFLAAARGDRAFTVVTAEVLRVGTIQRGLVGEGELEHQDVRLQVLVPPRDGALRRYAIVDAPLCPATSQQLHGISTPFGALAPGQVRTFVLGRGRPDFGALAKLLAHRARWLVLAGPEVTPPADPVLAAVPTELRGWLARSEALVFRARVVQAEAGEVGGGQRSLARQFDHLTVEVLQSVMPGSPLRPGTRVRLVQEPFLASIAVANLRVGDECWFVSEDAGLFHLLRAFVPPR